MINLEYFSSKINLLITPETWLVLQDIIKQASPDLVLVVFFLTFLSIIYLFTIIADIIRLIANRVTDYQNLKLVIYPVLAFLLIDRLFIALGQIAYNMYRQVVSFFLSFIIYITAYIIVKYPKRLSSLIGYKKKTLRLIFRMLGPPIVDFITQVRAGVLHFMECLKAIKTPLIMYNSTVCRNCNTVTCIPATRRVF